MRNEGEPISTEELDKYLTYLVGEDSNKALKAQISADEFAENILGFEEVEEGDDEDFEDQPGEEQYQNESQ